MGEVSTISLDIVKSVFQVHGVDVVGAVVIRKRVSRAKVLEYFGDLPPCLVGIEACPSAHHWGRELQALGHTVKLIPPSYVKAYLKRSKNDANDAAAICEPVTRPSMRFVPIKTKEQQTALMLHRARQLLVRQRTMLSNASRGHLAELGIVSAKGRNGTAELLRIIADSVDSRVSPAVRSILEVLARQHGPSAPRYHPSTRASCPCTAALKRAAGWRRSPASARSAPPIGCRDRRLEDILIGAQSCGLDRVGAEAAQCRRQGQARQHHQAGQSIFAVVTGGWRNGGHPLRTQDVLHGPQDFRSSYSMVAKTYRIPITQLPHRPPFHLPAQVESCDVQQKTARRRPLSDGAVGANYPCCKIIEMVDFRLSRRAISALNVIGNAK
jgi:transposase